LDEPSNHLDIESVEALIEAIENFSGSVIIVSHEEEILKRVADKLIICRENNQEIFDGDYDYFLEKIGWEEGSERRKKEAKDSKKDDKRKRAESVQERSKLIAPVKKLIEQHEAGITKLEADLSYLQKQLETAIARNDNTKIAEFTRKIGVAQKSSEALYQELESQYETLAKLQDS